ncbi:hypothetical protein BDW02DRAFT_509709 [Decorospora gaudefroyi]|uniref:Uncharacterized protein n=1 Tax=Decorospora gaudefroyi TaxID=184978 RepID=A0A6A5K4W8_9PLEO|nr:hypothetical protein BDW02DRAFT_509709 [Decorospora gaudefroyi]
MVASEQLLTLASLLGKVASAALIVPTSEALGQLKWNWFHDSRAMCDFEIFDKASRGPWGAALLLFRTKGRSLAALGALLIVLLLAIDSFFQQVATFPDRLALQKSSSLIPRMAAYRPNIIDTYKQGLLSGEIDRNIRNVLEQFFYENGTQPVPFGNGTRPDIPLTCPTSSCTWPEYETLAVCSSCTEVSHLLDITYTCLENATIDWSGTWFGPLDVMPYPIGTVCGFFLNSTSDAPLLLSGYVADAADSPVGEALLVRTIPLADLDTKAPAYGVGSINYKHVPYPILDALVASVTDLETVYNKTAPLVHECILSWCVQTVESSYERGKYSETVKSTFMNVTSEPDASPWPWNVTGEWFEYMQNITLQPPLTYSARSNATVFNTTYTVDNATAFIVSIGFDDFFPSSYTVKNNFSQPVLRYKNYPAGPLNRYLNFNPWLSPNNITRHMERLATTMMNAMRSDVTSKENLPGHAYDLNKFVSINWAWLTFPFILLILSLVFLVATIVKTSKDTATGMWKTSTIPTLIYSLPEEAQNKLNPSTAWNSAYESSKKVRIRLLPNRGWRVSGASHLNTSPQLPQLPHPAVQAPRGWI